LIRETRAYPRSISEVPMVDSCDVIIIGAGVIGCSTAYHLARMGIADVVVLEKHGSGIPLTTSKRYGIINIADLPAPGKKNIFSIAGLRRHKGG